MVKLTEEQKRQLEALDNIPDDEIDFSDIPPITDWSGFRMGLHYRPKWAKFSLKLDGYIADWFEVGLAEGESLGEAINAALSSEMYRIRFPLRVPKVEKLVQLIKEFPEKTSKLTGWEGDQIKALCNMPMEEVAYSNLHLRPVGHSKLRPGESHHPIGRRITLQLDENIVDWYEWLDEVRPRDEVLSDSLLNHIRRVESLRQMQPTEVPAKSALELT